VKKSKTIHEWLIGESESITHHFTERDIQLFQSLTGDNNPLHMDEDYASKTSAKGRVVHGMLAASYISTLIGVKIPGYGALWNDFKVNWRKMIRIGDSLRFEATISAINIPLETITLDIKGVGSIDNQIYLDGSAKVTIMSEKKKKKVMSNLENKVVIVTGASGMLGKKICEYLIRSGSKLIVWGRNYNKLNQLESNCQGSIVKKISCDFLNREEVKKISQEIHSEFNVAGIIHTAAAPLNFIESASSENTPELEKHLEVQVYGLNSLVTDFVNIESDEENRFVINILTEAVIDSPPLNMSAYVCGKMASLGLMRSYAKEHGQKGIRFNCISPGLMDTPYSNEISLRAKKIEEATNPMRKICTPEDVAQATIFLATNNFVNGANIPVTGGQRMA